MKKIITITISLLLVFSMLYLSSCNSVLQKLGFVEEKPSEVSTLAGKTPKELIKDTGDKLDGITNYTMNTKQSISYVYDGQIGQASTYSIIKSDGNNSYMLIESNGSNMEVWYVDGMCYISSQGQKVKTPLSIEQYKEQFLNSNLSLESLIDVEDAEFDSMVFKAKGDYWTLTFTIDKQIIEDIYKEFISGVTFNGDISFTWYFDDDGNLVKISNSFEYTASGINMKCNSVSTYDLTPVQISPPDDANSYTLDNSII